jgi:hypothetical protein
MLRNVVSLSALRFNPGDTSKLDVHPNQYLSLLRSVAAQSMSTARIVKQGSSQPRWIKGAIAGCAILGGVYFWQDEGARRTASFWSTAFPVYLHYRFVEKRVENKPEAQQVALLDNHLEYPRFLTHTAQEAEFQRLHNKYAHVMLDIILNMKG